MAAASNPSTSPSPSPAADRELRISRVFGAPRELVYKVFTDPHQIVQWWGPRGFTSTTFSMKVAPGGVWRYVMHGPDGRDYQNKVTYLEVVPNERLVFKHGGDDGCEPVTHTTTVTFAPEDGKTRVTMVLVFDSPEAKAHVVKEYGADKGMVETIDRLGEHLAENDPAARPFVISRTFNAPRSVVYPAWAETEQRAKWFGPKGTKCTILTDDFRPGGKHHYAMAGPDGTTNYGVVVYREIVPPQRIVYVNSFADKAGNVIRPPFQMDWPREMLTIVTFTENEGNTMITVQWTPHHSSPSEIATFDASHGGMTQGWGGSFDQLAEYLAGGR